jgi:hypothetical protein
MAVSRGFAASTETNLDPGQTPISAKGDLMKTLRILGLVSALALTAFTTAGVAFPTGTCKTTCYNPTTQQIAHVLWSATKAQCCGGTVNNCPAGYNPVLYSYAPTGGDPIVCD